MQRVLDPARLNQIPPGICALAIMTKAPRAGTVKTRLQPPLTAEEAADLNICFLRDTASAIARTGNNSRGVGVYTPVGAEATYSTVLPAEFDLIPQRGEHFGERLCFAIEDLLRVGFAACCLIDSDSPTVTSAVFCQAVEALLRAGDRIVLGPCDDGGYYLIGMKKLHRCLFANVDWSTARVLDQTIERAAQLGVEVHTLPPFYDVDDQATLRRLCGELLGDRLDTAPATKIFLADIIAREGPSRIWPEPSC
jgi:rSAM/selenodomain-associated transferase 1